MAHQHTVPSTSYNRAFAVGITLNTAFVVIEATWGMLSESLALIADAGHNLSDVLSLIIAWAATRLAQRKPTERLTYGLRRATILAPLFSATLLLMALGAMSWEAVERLTRPTPVQGLTMMLVALLGVVVNAGTAALFFRDHHKDLNIKGAYIHMVADAAISIGVVIAGASIYYTGWQLLDPAISLVIIVIIVHSTWGLLRDTLNLAIDAVPPEIDPVAVRGYLQTLPGVTSVHDLHIWGMSTTDTALTAHLVVTGQHPGNGFLRTVSSELEHRFGIGHSTVQIESREPQNTGDCSAAHCN